MPRYIILRSYVRGQPSTLSHPRSSLYFCHENGLRPASPPPATSITILPTRSRYKIYGAPISAPSAFLSLYDWSISDYRFIDINGTTCMSRERKGERETVRSVFSFLLFFFSFRSTDNVTRMRNTSLVAMFMDIHHVRLLTKLLQRETAKLVTISLY